MARSSTESSHSSPEEIPPSLTETSVPIRQDDLSTQPGEILGIDYNGEQVEDLNLGQEDTPYSTGPIFTIDHLIFSALDSGSLPSEPDPAFNIGSSEGGAADDGHGLISTGSDIDLSSQSIIAEIRQLCCAVYQRYPLWHLDTVLQRVGNDEHMTNCDFRTTCLSIFLLNESVAFRKNPSHGTSRLMRLVEEIESTRVRTTGSHFADHPSVDASIASLVLFIAYSICDRHNLAFYCLNEAAGLLRLVDIDMLDSTEVALYRRVEALLFVTESASMLVYGKIQRNNRMVACPENLSSLEASMQWYNVDYCPSLLLPAELSDIRIASLDIKAVNLLYVLVCLYNATTADEISSVPMSIPAVSDIIEHGSLGSTSIQAADVDITRQWQLCLRWQQVLSSRKGRAGRPRCNPSARYTLQIMGFTALQYSRSIRPEEYRIVGHGKLASLAMAMFDVASNLGILAGCTAVIGDLIRTVYMMDYERYFAPELSMVQLCIEEVPRQIIFAEQEIHALTEDGQGH